MNILLEFTPLEFETWILCIIVLGCDKLEFTPLEFETLTPRLGSLFSAY